MSMSAGALIGFGKGLQGFSNILGEKRKMDWEANQKKVAYERSMALEELRKKNNLESQQSQWKHEEEMYDKKLGDTRARDEMLRKQGMEDYETKLGMQQASDLSTAQQKNAMNLSNREAMAKQDLSIKEYQLEEYFKTNPNLGDEDKQKMRVSYLFNIKPEKAKTAKAPTEAMFRAAENSADALIAEEKLAPEQRNSFVRDTAWGLAADPKQTQVSLRERVSGGSVGGKWEPSDAQELANMSEQEAVQHLQSVRENEGESVWRQAMADYREAVKDRESGSNKPGALSSMWGKVKDFGTRNVREKRQDEMTPQERFQQMYDANK